MNAKQMSQLQKELTAAASSNENVSVEEYVAFMHKKLDLFEAHWKGKLKTNAATYFEKEELVEWDSQLDAFGDLYVYGMCGDELHIVDINAVEEE